MARRRKLPKLDLCRIHPERFRRMSSDQLMKVWARLGASRPSRTNANSLLKALVVNLAVAKSAGVTHKGNPTQRRHVMKIYMDSARRNEIELRALQAKQGCKR